MSGDERIIQAAALIPPFDITDGHASIQWKGTDVCMDVHCRCGAHYHVCAEFAYFVKCPGCDQIFEVNGNVKLHPVLEPLPEGYVDPVTGDRWA